MQMAFIRLKLQKLWILKLIPETKSMMFISNHLLKMDLMVDTVTTSDFHLHKKGTKVDLQMNENKLSKKFDIRIKANKVED